MTEIQFDDFDCGMMGMLDCPKCKNRIMPHASKNEVTIKEEIVNGKDPGWS